MVPFLAIFIALALSMGNTCGRKVHWTGVNGMVMTDGTGLILSPSAGGGRYA